MYTKLHNIITARSVFSIVIATITLFSLKTRESENVLLECIRFFNNNVAYNFVCFSQTINSAKTVVFLDLTPRFLVNADVSEETVASILVYLFDSSSSLNLNVTKYPPH